MCFFTSNAVRRTGELSSSRHTRLLSVAFAVIPSMCVTASGCGRQEAKHPVGPVQQKPAPSDIFAGAPTARHEKFTVYTTFYPTTYLTERIGGKYVDVVCPLPPDADAIFWQPSRAVITDYQHADLIVVNGAEFEKWVSLVSLPLSRVVNTADIFRHRWLKFETTVHSHGATGQHAHEGIDGHTWLDPLSCAEQAQAIAIALKRDLPDHSDFFDQTLRVVGNDLMALDERLLALNPVVSEALILCSHPAYNYIAARYGWRVTNLALDPGTEPTEEEWAHLKVVVDEAGPTMTVRVMLWETKPLAPVSKRMADELGVASIVFDPCEQADDDAGDYMARMNANIDRLSEALSAGR